uniref:Uncharacterized protein n=1 Tax=Rhizophagus irregularis (strain DAOM 181602 / DAOM 197198 / MUCL 43194) TaxID=747089 RepID=U9USQ1_RHIID
MPCPKLVRLSYGFAKAFLISLQKTMIYYNEIFAKLSITRKKKIMKRTMIYAFTLLVSIVNAITTFCKSSGSLINPLVKISPNPLVPGEYITFEVSGELSQTYFKYCSWH